MFVLTKTDILSRITFFSEAIQVVFCVLTKPHHRPSQRCLWFALPTLTLGIASRHTVSSVDVSDSIITPPVSDISSVSNLLLFLEEKLLTPAAAECWRTALLHKWATGFGKHFVLMPELKMAGQCCYYWLWLCTVPCDYTTNCFCCLSAVIAELFNLKVDVSFNVREAWNACVPIYVS